MSNEPIKKSRDWNGSGYNYRQWDEPHMPPSGSVVNISYPQKAAPVTLESLFPNLDRWSIGFDPFFAALKAAAPAAKAATYPPYNVKKYEDGRWRIDMALAGWRKDEIEVTVENRTLTISSNAKYTGTDQELEGAEKVYQGISQRAFTTNFALAEYVEVDSAKMSDGILTVYLVTNIPDELKPKNIDIQ